MSCPAWGFDEPRVLWYKDDVLVKTDSRVRLENDGDKMHRTLKISDIQDSDHAEYKCTATNSHGSMSRTVILRVTGTYTVQAEIHCTIVNTLHSLISDKHDRHKYLSCQGRRQGG